MNIKQALFLTCVFSETMLGLNYNFSSDIISYSKFGFNHSLVNEAKGQYPTDSFSVLYSNSDFHMKFNNHLDVGIGFAFGGLVYDSTKYDKDINGKYINSNGLAYKYFGYYVGYDGKQKASPTNTKDYFLSNLYLGYDNEFFSFKIGRFLFQNTDWLTGNQEGAEIHFKTHHTDVWGVVTEKKASLGGKWLKDFRFLNSSPMPTFAAGIKINTQHISINPYIQSQLKLYVMPAINFRYKATFSLWGIPIDSQTDLLALYIYHTLAAQHRLSVYDNGNTIVFGPVNIPTLNGYQGRFVGKGGESFLLKQIFRISQNNLKHHFGFQFYKNFGNSNEFVGGWGNPLGIDLNDSTVYDRGTANNAIFAANAFNNIIFYGLKYQKFNINIVNRYTISPRSDEESLSVNMDYLLPNKVSLGINLTYFEDTTGKNYQVYHTFLNHNIHEDRSYLSTYIKHSF
ncbi:outer membrane family protein [Helicobacter sp. 11S03491-1]|uniref:outer membrane family protein n=1 Tax=Helicobacter sp. 11S03491-1 TaxID=1476196 RepID=UPI000BA5453E|nr:outer membrane family protein [Helicobacter sp. 11S03491-1]PAF42547.1 hypothetical protein BKH45_03275 [Helicobacter sp. 11S03491-1]